MALEIEVSAATGSGPTVIAAFDDALRNVGVSCYNLVRLSSMIPPGPAVRSTTGHDLGGTWGDRLFAVWAFQSAELLGQEAWAGLGWLQEPNCGKGVFVEHEGTSESQVREELRASLNSLSTAHGLVNATGDTVVTGRKCDGPPVGALAIAPYRVEPWG